MKWGLKQLFYTKYLLPSAGGFCHIRSMGRSVSFERLVSLRSEIFNLGAVFCRLDNVDDGSQLSFRTNRQMLDFLWNVRSLTYEACAEHGLSHGWWNQLQKTYSEWESVRNVIAARYMPLVKSVARKYGHHNQDSSDLIQEGAKGMLRALDSYEVDRGVPFDAYARPWIQKYLSQCVECHSEVVRIPDSLAKRRRTLHDLESSTLTLSNTASRNPNFVCDLEIPDNRENPEQHFAHRETIRFLNQCVNNLDEDSRKVLQLHYGQEKRPSLEQIGEKCGFSREKTRKIEKKALKSLAERIKSRFFNRSGK